MLVRSGTHWNSIASVLQDGIYIIHAKHPPTTPSVAKTITVTNDLRAARVWTRVINSFPFYYSTTAFFPRPRTFPIYKPLIREGGGGVHSLDLLSISSLSSSHTRSITKQPVPPPFPPPLSNRFDICRTREFAALIHSGITEQKFVG